MTTLEDMIRGAAGVAEIAAHLDSLDAPARQAQANGLRRADQARLFEKAGDAPKTDAPKADAPAIRLTHFVPPGVAPGTPVHHPGRNTILTLPFFQRFEKRFALDASGARLFGYNASNAFFITPGYFVGYETDGRPEWERRGGVVIDYHQVPDGPVPEGWPKVRTNAEGLQRLVYHLTRDFMRKVSEHVSVGRAAREDDKSGDVLLDYWFTLCRPPMPATGALPASSPVPAVRHTCPACWQPRPPSRYWAYRSRRAT